MTRVLVPVDFSAHSFNALSYAHMLFQEVDVTFTLFNAYEAHAVQLLGNKSPLSLSTLYESLKAQSQLKLKELKKEIEGRNEIAQHTYNVKSYEGHLKEAIDAFTKADYDYIVMGSKGATGLKQLFLGSVTQSIVSLHQEIPLLIIPEKAHFRVPDTIGFATDFKRNFSKDELHPLINLINLWNSRLRMVEVYEVPILNPSQKKHLRQLESLLLEVNYSFHVIPEFSSLENCIHVFNEELNIDLMVLIDYPKNFFERLMREPVIKKMTFHTTLPFLILPGTN